MRQIPSPNHWNGREGHKVQWLILHGTDTNTIDYDGAYETASWFLTNNVSTNYVCGRLGNIAQCVQEKDAPYANGGISDNKWTGQKHDPWWGPVNPNLVTISIEHVKHAGNNNGDALTPLQKAASFSLIYDICKRNNIPMRAADKDGGITGHFSMDPANRSYCPGTFPWAELWAYLITRQKESTVSHEVAKFNQADQFLPGRSAYECGFYAVLMAKSMGETGPILTSQEISDQAQAGYTRYDGSNASGNVNGMTLTDLYNFLHDNSMHYQGTVLDLAHIRAWLRTGYPVIVAVAETCVLDLDLGDTVPYPWTPTGNHVLLLTGLDGDNFLARDSANIIAPNTLRPGPRRYDAPALARGLVSATAIVPSWLPRPTVDIDPNTVSIGLAGWTDTGKMLYGPDKKYGIGAGFRAYVLDQARQGLWNVNDVPLEGEHKMDVAPYNNMQLGIEGAGQCCAYTYLRSNNGVYRDRAGALASLQTSRLLTGDQEKATQQKLVADLQKELDALKSQAPTPLTTELYAALRASVQPLSNASVAINQLLQGK